MIPRGLPWRGPGPGRPDLPLPPAKLPLRRAGTWRKRWRYLGVFGDELLACAARVQVGPLGQTFWAFWDREERRMWERTRLRLPGARGEVWSEHLGEGEEVVAELGDQGVLDYVPDEGSLVRVDGTHPEGGEAKAFLRTGSGNWVEAVCPAEAGGYVWTRKRVVPVEVDVRVGEHRWRFEAEGVEDESAGYHPSHTVWSWSAGVGRTSDGRSVGWNLVSGVNDPPERSERAIWLDGAPTEPGPCTFEDLDAVTFADGSRLEFASEAVRERADSLLGVRSTYRQPFGSFTGRLPGGLEVEHGLGVMEHHDAHW